MGRPAISADARWRTAGVPLHSASGPGVGSWSSDWPRARPTCATIRRRLRAARGCRPKDGRAARRSAGECGLRKPRRIGPVPAQRARMPFRNIANPAIATRAAGSSSQRHHLISVPRGVRGAGGIWEGAFNAEVPGRGRSLGRLGRSQDTQARWAAEDPASHGNPLCKRARRQGHQRSTRPSPEEASCEKTRPPWRWPGLGPSGLGSIPLRP